MHKKLLINILMRLRYAFEWRKGILQLKKKPNTTKRTIDFHGRALKWLRKLYERWLLLAKVTYQKSENLFLFGTEGEKGKKKNYRRGITTPCREKKTHKTKKQRYSFILFSWNWDPGCSIHINRMPGDKKNKKHFLSVLPGLTFSNTNYEKSGLATQQGFL